MPLSGLDIYKLLPKTNCKECGVPTCLAFAMRLAQKQAELSACPYVSDAAKAALESASRPPIRLVAIGSGAKKFEVGNETVMFRHERTFYHEPGIVVRVKDTTPADAVASLVREISAYSVERVGFQLACNGFAVENASGNAADFASCVRAVRSATDMPIVLMSTNPAAIEAALASEAANKPLIYAATKDNVAAMADLAKKNACPLAIRSANGLDSLAELSETVSNAGIEDIVLDPGARGFGDSLQALTQIRRLALRRNFRPLGYPIITFPGEGATSPAEETALAAEHIAKYAGVIVIDNFKPESIYPLLTLRMNIYTDPQKPIQMQAGIYPLVNPTADSPLMVTTNYSLTYFSVAGEVESSGFPSWLLIVDTEGLSVVTSWAAGKFDAEKIAKAIKDADLSGIRHKKLIIPGAVAGLSGELEEELPDYKILVGPREAVDITNYLRRTWSPD